MRRIALLLFSWSSFLAAQNAVVVVNGASFRAGAPVAPGALVSGFGDFGGAGGDAQAVPLPTELAGLQVLVNEAAAPLLAVRPAQINFQMPRAVAAGKAAIRVVRGGNTVASGSVNVAATGPGLFVVAAGDPSRPGAVLNQDSRLNLESNRARRGEVLQIFATGQGATSPAVEDGSPGSAQPLARTPTDPKVFIGPEQAEVLFSGLSPQFAGLWQINARVPASSAVSGQVPLFVSIGGRTSNAVTLWVEP